MAHVDIKIYEINYGNLSNKRLGLTAAVFVVKLFLIDNFIWNQSPYFFSNTSRSRTNWYLTTKWRHNSSSSFQNVVQFEEFPAIIEEHVHDEEQSHINEENNTEILTNIKDVKDEGQPSAKSAVRRRHRFGSELNRFSDHLKARKLCVA